MKSRLKKPVKIQTVLAGLLLILNGNSVLDKFPAISITLFILGGVLLVYVFAVSLKIPQDSIIKPLVIFLEGIGFLATSYVFFKLGKIYLPYGYLLAALICFFGVVIIGRRMKKQERRKQPQGN
ncbi:hypothetical protein LZ575_07290 [Antarcticibacterium sp. 1MA-6-2]|uniref:hypothetical protein n=1 Tax=Antarcticibacterium sp. 1MA-6-2 TaxID=2908210 RepID=UPI001F36CC60|nr:hypothetical protein [Antarcticibacterium sp. 1MA-6-2]UJH92326.1 hypothetical protein LZ575_07290 [Antarcticibacterium sp. 1MA-6-2]